MHVLRRLVWWKIVGWSALGAAMGYAVSTVWPEPGTPAGAERVMAERFVTVLTPPRTSTKPTPATLPASAGPAGAAVVAEPPPPPEAITDVVLYPPHEGVRLLTFDWQSGGKSKSGYAFANTPFARAGALKSAADELRSLPANRLEIWRKYRPIGYLYATTLRDAADAALADMEARPGQRWADVTEFLDFLKTSRPGFAYRTAWWADVRWRRDMPIAAGLVSFAVLAATLTRRSEADVLAADLLRAAGPPRPAPAPQPAAAKDLSAVVALDDLLEAKLAADADPVVDPNATHTLLPAPAAVRELVGERLVAQDDAPKEDKDYAGEFYPTVRVAKPKAFSLVELLVAIGVIGVLMGLLLPAVIGARRSADTIACASNLRQIATGITLYVTQNRYTFPAAYLYNNQKFEAGGPTGTSPSDGYVHWSSYLFGNGSVNPAAFQCPALRQGGLPPTNTPPENRDPGQKCPNDTLTDHQAPRLAYTVNEALCPRNKFNTADFNGHRVYRFVKTTEVGNASGTILATEWLDNAIAVSYDVNGTGWIMSHRPVAGFVGLDGELDMYAIPIGTKFRRAKIGDLDADPQNVAETTHTRLDLVGRNHGKKVGYPDRRVTNFAYVDGHVETKSVYDTLQPAFEWGEKFFSLTPNNDLVDD